MEFTHNVALLTAGALREDQITAAVLYFPGYRLNDLQRLANVTSVHGEGLGHGNDLFDKGDIFQFLLQHTG